ncbi:MAG: radical SAM protein [Candidatus Omnitrophica bacterium]|nr:radical SAM protein [Candidatus Omnitrophota bacterium]MDD5236485.1 radical SAM protein [Candidatus Omnitrophota bacterium]
MRKLIDPYGRQITYLRIAVTKRCNLRCVYCFPTGAEISDKADLLSGEEIINIATKAVACGITKIRFTGGEPLLRKDIISLISRTAAIKGIQEVALTTNGIFLADYAKELKKAGLKRVNVSLDSLRPEIYEHITKKHCLNDVLHGIKTASQEGLEVKLNFVVLEGVNDMEQRDFIDFCKRNGYKMQFIKKMDFSRGKESSGNGDGSLFHRPPDCRLCNKIRLTSDGLLLPCLFSKETVNIRDYKDEDRAIARVVSLKPKNGCTAVRKRSMIHIGG